MPHTLFQLGLNGLVPLNQCDGEFAPAWRQSEMPNSAIRCAQGSTDIAARRQAIEQRHEIVGSDTEQASSSRCPATRIVKHDHQDRILCGADFRLAERFTKQGVSHGRGPAYLESDRTCQFRRQIDVAKARQLWAAIQRAFYAFLRVTPFAPCSRSSVSHSVCMGSGSRHV